MKSITLKILFSLVVICLTSNLKAQLLGRTDNHEIMSISNLRITSNTHLKSKKSYSLQEFVNEVNQGSLKSKKESERYFDLTSDEWVTMITTDGFSIHKEAFEKGYFGSSSLKSDEFKLVDEEGNIYSVGSRLILSKSYSLGALNHQLLKLIISEDIQ